jgi:hypothetical protein
MSSTEQQLDTKEGWKILREQQSAFRKGNAKLFASAKRIDDPEQQQHELTILYRKQIERTSGDYLNS